MKELGSQSLLEGGVKEPSSFTAQLKAFKKIYDDVNTVRHCEQEEHSSYT